MTESISAGTENTLMNAITNNHIVQLPNIPNILIMENEKGLSIDLKQEVAKGSYSNLAIITHSHSEFIIDFASMLPGLPKPEVTNRIIMTPEHAKRLFLALQDNINKYETQNGPITFGDTSRNTFPMGGLGGNNGAMS